MAIVRLFHLFRDIVEVIKCHDQLERRDIKTGMGIYAKDNISHVHIAKGFKNGDSN